MVKCEAQACGCNDVHYGHGAGPERACLYQAMFGHWAILGHWACAAIIWATGTSIVASRHRGGGRAGLCSPWWFCVLSQTVAAWPQALHRLCPYLVPRPNYVAMATGGVVHAILPTHLLPLCCSGYGGI